MCYGVFVGYASKSGAIKRHQNATWFFETRDILLRINGLLGWGVVPVGTTNYKNKVVNY